MGKKSNSQRLGKLCFLSRKSTLKPSSSQEKISPLIVEELRGKFYKHYREEAGKHDKEFLKKHDEDLNTTLIFVCCTRRSGIHVLNLS